MSSTITSERLLRSERDTALPRVDHDLIRWHAHAALITVLISAMFGLIIAAKFNLPGLLGDHAWSTWGRLRYNHTEGIFFGWLGNAFIAFCYYAVPPLANRPVASRKLGWLLFWIWNGAVVLPGWTLVCLGFSQPLEWAEFPLIVDLFVVIGFLLMIYQFVKPFLRVPSEELYVSSWYIIGGLVFTALAYPVGALVPDLVPGARGAAFSGLWIHDAVGLFVTPLALAMAYYVIPSVTGKPIYSHFLSMLGFWLLFFVYPLNGMHHYVYSALPMTAQRGAIAASMYLGVDVILVVTNLLLSLRKQSGTVGHDVPLRFVWTGVLCYLVVSLQGSMQASMSVNRFIHFSDWVIGHSHLAMIGFASFIAIGAIAHMWRSLPGVRFNERALVWSYWLLLIGMVLMVSDLTAAGLVEGQLWVSKQPWIDSVRAAWPFWLVRTISGLPILTGFVLFWASLVTGPRNEPARVNASDEEEQANVPSESSPMFGYALVVSFVAGLGFFVLSFVALGVIPGRTLQAEIAKTMPAGVPRLTPAELHGRVVFGREGCAYCHTEQVRFLQQDVARFGAPTEPWETEYDYPQLWGTRRVGPDLARESGIRPDDWQLTHLYNPRFTVPDSVMPSYAYLFHGSAKLPSQDALDLVAYMQTLGKARALTQPRESGMSAAMPMQDMPEQTELPANIPMPKQDATAPSIVPDPQYLDAEIRHGSTLFKANCEGCHGQGGEGGGPAAASLLPQPTNLTTTHFSNKRLSVVLWTGRFGSAMPAWRQMDRSDLRDLIAYVASLQPQNDVVTLTEQETATAKALFTANCASCHGQEGDGDGPAAGAMSPGPANFHTKQPSMSRATEVIAHGIPGSSMPGWSDKLSAADRDLLARWVRSLYPAQEAAR
jgi:cbb3-type cytochrome c oxidase subunit I